MSAQCIASAEVKIVGREVVGWPRGGSGRFFASGIYVQRGDHLIVNLIFQREEVAGHAVEFLAPQALAVGDVSGKGLPAALMMSSLQARVQMLRETMPDPGTAVRTLNRRHTERCPLGKFITFFYALLDPPSGALEYSNAGHNYPLVLRTSGVVERLKGNGLVLGLFAPVEYEVRKTVLASGELLALYSDGVTEASNGDGKEFGEDGLADFLAARKDLSCEEIVNQLVDHMRKWRGNTSFADDFTIVLVRRL